MNAHKKFFSHIGRNYLILGIISIASMIILINIITLISPQYLTDMNDLSMLSSFCNYILPFPIFYWLMRKLDKKTPEKSGVSLKRFLIYTGITITLMWIGNIIGLIITTLLSGAIQSEISNPVQQLINSTDMWFNIIIVSIIGPIFEEIFFRKMLIDRSIKYGAKVSIILSAVLFGFFHGNLNQFFYALLMGGFFAYVYIKTGKITYTILLHSIVNILGSVISLIFANSVMSLQSGFNLLDIAIILGYFIFFVIFLAIGVYGLCQFRKAKLNGEKTEINLKSPIRTMFLNKGMILFIGFFILVMIYQILG